MIDTLLIAVAMTACWLVLIMVGLDLLASNLDRLRDLESRLRARSRIDR